MGFFDEIINSPNNSGIYGSGRSRTMDLGGVLSADSELRRRDMNDFKNKNQFMSDLSLRQNRLGNVFNTQTEQQKPMNVVFKDDSITPFQKAQLDIKKDDNTIDRAKLAQTSKLGEEKLDLAKAGHELDVKKNQNIYDTKHAEMQRKVDESNNRLGLAYDQLQNKQNDANSQINYHKAQMDALKAQHELDNHRRDSAAEETKRMHDAQIQALQDRIDQTGNTETTTELDESGKKRTVKVKKGTPKIDKNDPLGIR